MDTPSKFLIAALSLVLGACGPAFSPVAEATDPPAGDAGTQPDSDADNVDPLVDAGAPDDAAVAVDSSPQIDSGAAEDAGTMDAATAMDSALLDSASPTDAALPTISCVGTLPTYGAWSYVIDQATMTVTVNVCSQVAAASCTLDDATDGWQCIVTPPSCTFAMAPIDFAYDPVSNLVFIGIGQGERVACNAQ